jgi:alginate O-acetyltransferase complex protein AlgI
MSLGRWFRDYLYFPLGGSRVTSKWRLIFNLAIVWAATGVWHGANWTFILWGALYGVIIIFEKLYDWPKKVKTSVPFRLIYQPSTLLFVVLGWVLFRATNLTNAVSYLKAMFGIDATGLYDDRFLFNIDSYGFLLLVAIFCSTPVLKNLTKRLAERHMTAAKIFIALGYLLQLLFFIFGISFLVMNAHNPFIYFNF